MVKTIMAALLALGSAAHAAPGFVASPYKFLPLYNDAASNVITVAPEGRSLPYVQMPGATALTWAFAVGECGKETWGGQPGAAVAAANVGAFAKSGIPYIISTGGQGAVFNCGSKEGMDAFVARYDSPQLIGFDFDIEAGQTKEDVRALLQQIVHAQRKHPRLRFSFTIATHAASDGSRHSLNETAELVLAEVRRSGLKDFVMNLMVMDYGPASKKVCVLRGSRCDMGASAIQAARNVHEKYKLPYSQIELTPMIGVNDVVENVFTLEDAKVMVDGVRKLKMAGVHFWSLDRDVPCRQPASGAEAACSTMPDVQAGAYTQALVKDLAR
ncbi:glycoside hydrolase family 18 protein [Massilia endophytica]|uniref:glycosyl hydrolase n=1 Tax=Massilia endophytica TaxID=2899220 RepID=UPI001E568667|nr:glycosyl hydrolase [Massilia endophytica]UGQ47494.1 glycosyl hydrolase [Massilia endophytica]